MRLKSVQLAALLSLLALSSALSCASNQFYNQDVSCVNCPQNCATCSNAQFCTSCTEGLFLVSNAFNVTCQTCSQIYIGCNTCLANVACTNCNPGYFLNNAVCSPCSVRNIFCIYCSNDGAVCTLCGYPFILVNGLCVSATVSTITGGAAGSTSSTPTSPDPANTTTPAANLVTLANGTKVAAIYDGNGCNQIQIFFQGKCLQAISNCVYYQVNGLCGYCATGFVVTIFGDCSVNNRILACEAGFWLNRNLDVCVKVSPACDWYFPGNGSCINCSKGYDWVNNTCVNNVSCNSRQYFYQGVCIDQPAACATFTSNGTCTTCAQGFSLLGGVCNVNAGSIVSDSTCTFPCLTCH
jgi:hypothetical protein